jgi:dimethylamine corrinoid protein
MLEMSKEEILKGLTDAVVRGDREASTKLSQDALAAGIDAYEALMKGCAKAMEIMSDRYDKMDAFVPDILVSADAMYGAIEVLKPHIKVGAAEAPGKVVLGTIEGDIHDIGKNIVKILLDIAGFEVIDLGRNVPLKQFVEKVRETKADIIGLSALMSTSMLGMPETIELIKDAGLRDKVKIMVGGAPVSAAYAEQVGADGYAENAPKAIKLAERLVKEMRGGS